MMERKSKSKKESMDHLSVISKYINELDKKNTKLKANLEKLIASNEVTKQKITEINSSAKLIQESINNATKVGTEATKTPDSEQEIILSEGPSVPNTVTSTLISNKEESKTQKATTTRKNQTYPEMFDIDVPTIEARILNNPRKGKLLAIPVNDKNFERLTVSDTKEINDEEVTPQNEQITEKGLIRTKTPLPPFQEVLGIGSSPKFNINKTNEKTETPETPDSEQEIILNEEGVEVENIETSEPYPLVVTNSNELNKADTANVDTAVAEIFHEYEEVLDDQIERETKVKKPTAGQKVAWLKNKIANAVGGIGSKIKDKIISESAKRLMRKGVMVFTFTSAIANNTSGSLYEHKDNSSTLDFSNVHVDDKEYFVENGVDLAIYDSLTTQAKEIYLKHCTGEWDFDTDTENNARYNPYIIVDKPTAKEYVFDADNKLIACFPIIRGAALGEGLNMSDVNSDKPGEHATSPMGEYEFYYNSRTADLSSYDGRIFSIISEGAFKNGSWAMHETYKGELEVRTAALNSETPKDNNMSWGCINADASVFDQYLLPTFGDGERYKIFITADDTNIEFVR